MERTKQNNTIWDLLNLNENDTKYKHGCKNHFRQESFKLRIPKAYSGMINLKEIKIEEVTLHFHKNLVSKLG